jgi:hypothetical protein
MQDTQIPYADLLRFIDRFRYEGQKVFEVRQKNKKIDTENINPKAFEKFQIVYLANPWRPPIEDLGEHSTIIAYTSNVISYSSIYWNEDWFDSYVDDPYESLERKLREQFGYGGKKNKWLYFDKSTRPLINKTIRDSIFATQFAIAIIGKSEREKYKIKSTFHDVLYEHYDGKINLAKNDIEEFSKVYTECENL